MSRKEIENDNTPTASKKARERARARARVHLYVMYERCMQNEIPPLTKMLYKRSFNWRLIRIALIFVRLLVNLGSLIRYKRACVPTDTRESGQHARGSSSSFGNPSARVSRMPILAVSTRSPVASNSVIFFLLLLLFVFVLFSFFFILSRIFTYPRSRSLFTGSTIHCDKIALNYNIHIHIYTHTYELYVYIYIHTHTRTPTHSHAHRMSREENNIVPRLFESIQRLSFFFLFRPSLDTVSSVLAPPHCLAFS